MRPPLALFRFEEPPFAMPVRESQQQPWNVRIPREKLRFDRGDFALAAFDLIRIHSRRRPRAFQRNFIECAAAL